MQSTWRGLRFLRRESVQIALLVAFALAAHLSSHRSHWFRPPEGDEVGQIKLSRQPLRRVVTHYQSGQNHPLYGILAHFAIRALPVADIYAARLPALLAGLAIPLAFYYTQRRRAGRPAALLVAYILVAADPLHYYASAARGYTLMVLGVLLANDLLLTYLREGRPAVLVAYTFAATAAAYSHLWGALVLPAHLVFLLADAIRERSRMGVGKRMGLGGAAVLVVAVFILLLYLPMIPEIRSMAGHRGEAPLGLIDKVLGLVRFRSWTTAAYVLLVPIALEGCARRSKRAWPDRALCLHVTIICSVVIAAAVTEPANFYRRFLMVIIPSGAALAARCFAGLAKRQSLTPAPRPSTPAALLPLPAIWLAGFALGVLVSNASMSSFMSWQFGAHTDDAGRDHDYYYRNLPKAVESLGAPIWPGFPVAVALLVAAAIAIGWRVRRSAAPVMENRRTAYFAAYVWTAVLLAGIAPLLLGPHSTPGRPWLFEVHTIAAATLCLLAWRYRDDRRLLRALRHGLLLSALVLVYWQLGVEQPRLDGSALVRMAALIPPALAAAGMLYAGEGRCAK